MDLVLRNGTIIDGTGGVRYSGDVGIRDGKIVAVGIVDGRGDEEVDVAGAVIAPGFIDCHTHYDAQVMWDETLSPSIYHGVTTVIAGNCGFTLAPLSGRQEDVDYLLGMLSNVEGMPIETLEQAVTPDWRSFGEYLDRLDGKLAINAAFMVGHSALRQYVMGDRAVGHEAAPEEVAAMAELLRRSIEEGGMGFSSTVAITHSDHRGNPVPSRWASDDEIIALARVAGEFSGTWIEMLPGVGELDERAYQLATNVSLAAQRPLNWNLFYVDSRHPRVLETQLLLGPYAAARGAKVLGLCPAAPIKTYLNFRSAFVLGMLEGWMDFINLPHAAKIAAMRDPEIRAKLRECAETAPQAILKNIGKFQIDDVRSERNMRWKGRLVEDYAREIGLDPFDALFELAIEEDLWLSFSNSVIASDEESWDMRGRVWRDEYSLIGASDAGAHLDLLNTFARTTQLLGEGVRERQVLSLEEGVRKLTGDLAEAFGLKDRGRLVPGAAADIVVFDPDTIACGPISMRDDLPGGQLRLYAESIGIHHVIANGVRVAHGNEATGLKGGRILRSGKDTYTVSLKSAA
jgi:N-acyl-D-aspartate/D-glutamate deacylase